jgi:hypothetical protein
LLEQGFIDLDFILLSRDDTGYCMPWRHRYNGLQNVVDSYNVVAVDDVIGVPTECRRD